MARAVSALALSFHKPGSQNAHKTGYKGIAMGARAVRAAVAAVLGLALGAVGLVVVVPRADAHTPSVTATCNTLDVNLTNYRVDSGHPETFTTVHHAAVGTPTIPNPEYKPAVAEVFHMGIKADQRFSWTGGEAGPGSTSTPLNDSANWQGNTSQYNGTDVLDKFFQKGQGNASWFFWTTTSVKVIDTPATVAVGTPTIPNPKYVAAFDEKVSNHDFVAPLTNHVTVTVNEVVVKDVDFGASFTGSYSFLANQSNTYTVKVTAWDDPTGGSGWTKTFSGTQAGCVTSTSKLPPKVESGSQTCTVGNQGLPSLTGGQIVLGTSAGVSTKVMKEGAAVSPLTGLLPGTYTIVASLTDAGHSSWVTTLPAGWTSSGDGTVSYSVTIGAANLTECTVAQPKAVITYGDWTGTPTCENPSIYQTRDVFTAVYSWIEGKWVGTPVKTGSETATEPMALTDAEYFTQCAPSKPTKDPLVVPGEYGGAAPTCTTPSVVWTRTLTTTTYDYVWNTETRVWDMVTATPVVTTDPVTQTMVRTADQVKACTINLTLTKTVTSPGPYFGGTNVTYSLVPHNDGPVDALAGWSVTEVLPEGSMLIGLSGDGYVCLTNLVCTSRDTLAAGADGKAITAIVQIPEGVTGSFKNVAYVSPSPKEITETNPLVVPTISTDTASTPTDNDAQGVVTVLSPQEEGITITLPNTGVVTVSPQVEGITITIPNAGAATGITLPNTGATIPLTWFLGASGLLAAGLILVGASMSGARSRKN